MPRMTALCLLAVHIPSFQAFYFYYVLGVYNQICQFNFVAFELQLTSGTLNIDNIYVGSDSNISDRLLDEWITRSTRISKTRVRQFDQDSG